MRLECQLALIETQYTAPKSSLFTLTYAIQFGPLTKI